SVGRTQCHEFVPVLLRHLGDRADRRAAREALAAYGISVVGILSIYLNDTGTPMAVRRRIPRVLSLIGSQHAVDALLNSLAQSRDTLRYRIIKALNKLRAHYPELHFDQRVNEALIQEISKYYRLLAALRVIQDAGVWEYGSMGVWEYGSVEKQMSSFPHTRTPVHPHDHTTSFLLERALRERLDDHFECIFRLLGLLYPPRDIYNAYVALRAEVVGSAPGWAIRASAVEFLDNILPNHLKRTLLPIVEELPVEHVLQSARGLLGTLLSTHKETLQNLVSDGDTWLRVCALYEIGARRLEELRFLAESAKRDEDPLVQETAMVVLERYL
ncbi:MAG: hypothetical protein MN733_04860, partial [Nitrososphaera sp.]|nr:hypothetical protein [Nitrososphaera sp.]